MYKWLPIGSVVLLKNTDRRIMIYGRHQKDNVSGKIFDYAGCFYPEGIIDSKKIMLFSAEDIRLVFFVGFQDYEELIYRDALKRSLEE